MKKSVGRPSKITTIDREQMRKLYIAGWTDAQVGDFFGVCKDTISEWKNRYPDLFAALKDWKKEADLKVEKSLYERACGFTVKNKKAVVVSDGHKSGSHVEMVDELIQYPPDSTAMIFWLKNRKPEEWRDRQEHEHILKEYKHDVLKDKSVSELRKEAEQIAENIVRRRATASVN